METRQKLRIGILVDAFVQPAWVASIVEQIVDSDWGSIELAVINDAPKRARGIWARLWQNGRYAVYALYARIDSMLFSRGIDPFAESNIAPLVSDCDKLHVLPEQKKYSDFLKEEDVAKIRSHNVDVLLRFGFRILRGSVLRSCRYGIWSFHHGDSAVNRGGPPGFWEVMNGEPVTGAVLQVLSESLDGGRIIDRCFCQTKRRSPTLNRQNLFLKAGPMMPRGLKRLWARGEEAVFSEPERYTPYSRPLYRAPTNAKMVWLLLRQLSRFIRRKLRNAFYFSQWFLMFRVGRSSEDPNNALYQFSQMIPPRDRFWADPIVVARDDGFYVFIEEFLYKEARGHISVIEMMQDGSYGVPRVVLKRPYHLSYPFVFEHESSHYMIPETAANRTIELYRSRSFPDDWELVDTLFEDVVAADTTMHRVDDLWWLFTAISKEDGLKNVSDLFLFSAPSPLGPWTPHVDNPVKTDVRSSRPGGPLFEYRGTLYRPAQDCSLEYGGAMSICEVVCLSKERYEERVVGRVSPDWEGRLVGTHTLSRVTNLTVVDGLRLRRRFLP